ncbi:ROK family protein [Candidatus Parcubacteria bacterium]|nr:ROK family protein [Candidatus Parcubacteria bacterium]
MIMRVIDGGGSLFRRADVDTEDLKVRNFKKIQSSFSTLEDIISFAKEELLAETAGIAFAVAGVIENSNKVIASPNIPLLNGVALGDVIFEKLKLKTIVLNDMEASVMGMAGLLPKENYFMGITWSSGIGVRIFHNGKLIPVSEGGHMKLSIAPNAPVCGCGNKGCAEAFLGGIKKSKDIQEKMKELGISFDGHPNAFLDQEFLKGEAWAVEYYQSVADRMGLFLANIQTLLYLPLIVWKGTVALKSLPLIEDDIRKAMAQYLIEPRWADKDHLRFLMSPELEHDGMIGAAQAFTLTK